MSATSVAAQQRQPPSDDDLLDLYNQVWEGFVGDSPTSLDPHSPSSARLPDTDGISSSYSSQQGYVSPANGAALTTDVGHIAAVANQNTVTRTKTSRRPLPLPPTPSSSLPSNGMTMPEPKYFTSPPPQQPPPLIPPPPPPPNILQAGPSEASTVLPNGTVRRPAGYLKTRRLPAAPVDSPPAPYSLNNINTSADGNLHQDYTPRLRNQASYVSLSGGKVDIKSTGGGGPSYTHGQSASLSSRPPTSIGFYSQHVPNSSDPSRDRDSPHWQGGGPPNNTHLPPQNFRPKGALSPVTPGLTSAMGGHDAYNDRRFPIPPESPDSYGSSPSRGSTDVPPPPKLPDKPQAYRPSTPNNSRPQSSSHVAQMPAANQNQRPPVRTSSRQDLQAYARLSGDDLGYAGPSSSVARAHQAPTNIGATPLGRSTSAQSTVSSHQTGRTQASTSQSIYTNSDNTIMYEPSTPATTVERGKSLSSVVSIGSASSSVRPQDSVIDIYRQPSIVISETAAMNGYLNYQAAAESSSTAQMRRTNEFQRSLDVLKRPLELHEDEDLDYDEEYDYDDDDENRFFNLALLSHLAVRLRDKVPRGTHVKGGIPYPRAFTGKDIVSTLQAMVQRDLLVNLGISTSDRRPALQVARSLQSQLFFYEVEWGGRTLQDGVEDVYMFLDDQDGGVEARPDREELPNGVFTVLTKCYTPSCMDGQACYSYSCPRRRREVDLSRTISVISTTDSAKEKDYRDWADLIDPEVLKSIPQSEINRQTIIHKAISKEELYVQDLDIIDSLFIKPLRSAVPPVIPPEELDKFMQEVFSNILDVRECNRRLLEVMAVRQREQSPIIQKIGDIFLTAATEFRLVYPYYIGSLPLAEKRLKEEIERNANFKLWLDQCLRHPDSRRLDLKHFLTRPSEHLHKYTVTLEAVRKETVEGNPDAEFLLEAIQAIEKLSSVAHLRTFQSAMGRGPTGKLEWYDLVAADVRQTITRKETKRQSIIFELIKGEMSYVKDLEVMETLFIRPLRNSNPPIITHDRLNLFLQDVFHNYSELLVHHRKLLDHLHEIQRDEHPLIHSITAPLLDAALNWQDAYMNYVPNYPIGWYRIDEEYANNTAFKAFFDQSVRHPDAHKLDMKSFIHRPIARLLRYDLLLSSIMNESPPSHEDRETIPQVLEVLRSLGKKTDSVTEASKEKVEIWRYNSNLVFKPGETIDMDLLHESRSLVHTGKLWRQPETGFEWNGWTELHALLFDNYMVLTKPKEKDGVTKYNVNRRPIPLDLLTLVNFTDPPQQRGKGLLGGLRSSEKAISDSSSIVGSNTESSSDSRFLYPCTIHHNGRLGGLLTVYAESSQARIDWKKKLDEAVLLRKVVTDANKVFEVETLSSETFLVPSMHANPSSPAWHDDVTITGKVTCSVPFSTADGRGLVAIGCAEGVWIGLRHDPRSMRRVLHLKMVTQCAMLQEFGIFLVLADKALFAYHIEALVPSTPSNTNTARTPQKLNGNKDVQFFSVGTLNGRTLIIYMKKKGLDSVFRVLEPVVEKITERARAPGGLGRFGFGSQRSDWFRVYRDFFLPSEAHDLIFLKAKIAILCSKGFEIMELADFKSVTIPQRDDPRLQNLAKRCESCKPIGMFRSNEDEFLLCYDEFGLYVNRHGDPSRSLGTIEWEGTAERAAYHPPYVLLFDTRFIEIRHVETGRLVQIIPGNDIRCIWDGRGSSLPPVQTPGPNGWSDTPTPEARVHAVMKATDSSTSVSKARAVPQHIFQLVPTIPLYLPESLSSSSATYFPENASPSNSPPMTPRHSWR